MSKPIHQTVEFPVPPHAVYEALMDSKKHARFTHSTARISRKVGGAIMAYDGYITGRNLELVPDRRIVQAWRAVDWPEGVLSTITFELTSTSGGTRLDFTHTQLPEGTEQEFARGWQENYWEPMQAMFSSSRQK